MKQEADCCRPQTKESEKTSRLYILVHSSIVIVYYRQNKLEKKIFQVIKKKEKFIDRQLTQLTEGTKRAHFPQRDIAPM
jgi:hypothetical protein